METSTTKTTTRDEVHHFQTVDDVLCFLEANALDATRFKP
jgi:hypothetical protein